MKKQLLLIAGTVLTLASCQNEAANTTDNQAQIDSAVNARVEELRMEMMMQNDSIINAEAQRRADSIVAAMGNANSSTPPKKTATPSKPTENTTSTAQPTKSPEKVRNNDVKSVEEQKRRNNDASKTVEQQKKRNNQ